MEVVGVNLQAREYIYGHFKYFLVGFLFYLEFCMLYLYCEFHGLENKFDNEHLSVKLNVLS